MNVHLPIPTTIDAILDELEEDEAARARSAETRARIRECFSGDINTAAQRAVEGRAASDRKQVARLSAPASEMESAS